MVRNVLGVVIGCAVMVAIVHVSMFGMYEIMGSDLVFEPETYVPSLKWIIGAAILGFVAALIGGMTCKAISRSMTAAIALAVLCLLTGLAMSYQVINREINEGAVRDGDISYMKSMEVSNPPNWAMLINPPIGIVGVLIGASLIGRGKPDQ